MDDPIKRLKEKLADLEAQVREQEERIPPHSVRPHQIEELERLEEERGQVKEELDALLNPS